MTSVGSEAAAGEARPRSYDGGGNGSAAGASAVALAAGVIAAIEGLSRRTKPGLLIAGIGGALLLRGAQGSLEALGVRSARRREREKGVTDGGIDIGQSCLIYRSPGDLYREWRDFKNLPRFMTYLEKVEVRDDRRSHWIAAAPAIAGGKAEWDAEIVHDEKNRRIAWRSLPGSEIDVEGEVRFRKAPGDRGTEVYVKLKYMPPGGQVGHWVAKMFGKSPQRTIREDLRNFKRMMETGDLPTTEGQPRGTCTGVFGRKSIGSKSNGGSRP